MCTVIFPRVNIRFKSYRLVETFTDLSIRNSIPYRQRYPYIHTYIYIYKGPGKKRNRKKYYPQALFLKVGIIARLVVTVFQFSNFYRFETIRAIDARGGCEPNASLETTHAPGNELPGGAYNSPGDIRLYLGTIWQTWIYYTHSNAT